MTMTAGLKKFTVPARTSPRVRPGIAHHADRSGVTAADEPDDVTAAGRLGSLAGEPLGERLAPRDGLEAADVAAAADDLLAGGHPDVADVAGRAAGAAMDVAVGDDAAADPGADLDQSRCCVSRQWVRCSPRAMMFTSLSTSTGAA